MPPCSTQACTYIRVPPSSPPPLALLTMQGQRPYAARCPHGHTTPCCLTSPASSPAPWQCGAVLWGWVPVATAAPPRPRAQPLAPCAPAQHTDLAPHLGIHSQTLSCSFPVACDGWHAGRQQQQPWARSTLVNCDGHPHRAPTAPVLGRCAVAAVVGSTGP